MTYQVKISNLESSAKKYKKPLLLAILGFAAIIDIPISFIIIGMEVEKQIREQNFRYYL